MGFTAPIFVKFVLAEQHYVWTFNAECHLYGEEMRGIRVGILVRPSVIVRIFTARGSYNADSILRARSVDLQYRVLSI
jgi:hypothetical protein